MLKYFQRKRERERERERKCVSLSCFKQTRRERENKERNKKCIIPRETRERRFCVGSHVAFIHRLFGRKDKKNSLSSRFSVVLTDIYLSHHHRVVSIFPLLTRARTQSRRFRKKKRARTRFRHMENEFSRAKIALAHAAFRSRVPLLLSKTKSNTRQLRIIVKSRYTS